MLRGIKTKGLVRRSFGGFTIVELLTVMSIIIILISVLVPALSKVRRYAKVVTQKGQFHEISKGLELFRADHSDTYPDSGASDSVGDGYCGAMKMCEALLGQDGMGFHPLSNFHADQQNTYRFDLCVKTEPSTYDACDITNLQERIKYVDSENIKTYRLQDIYTWAITPGMSFYDNNIKFKNTIPGFPNAVIGDVFLRADIKSVWCPDRAGQKAGMPVLYYKADPSKIVHDPCNMYVAPNPNIYNFDDNYGITTLGCSWETGAPPVIGGTGPSHPMQTDPLVFYKAITNTKATATPRPHNEDTYILMSAGWDGLYGTRDDVFNFAD